MDEEFAQCLEKTDCTESAIEVSYVKHVMDQHWEGVFAPHFRSRAETLRELDRVRYARNQVAHPAYRQDLDGIETSRFLDSAISLLCAIGARDGSVSEAVANIKAELESPGVQNGNATKEFGRLEAQFDKIVVELEETRGFLWKVESELDYTKGNLKEEESARRNAEKVAQVAELSNCRLTDELQSEVAAKRDAEQMTDQVEKRLMRTESDLDSMNGNLKKEKAARKRADKRSQDAQASLCQVNEELKLAAVARREAEKSAQEESKGRQLAEQTALTLQATLEQTEKELSSTKGELKRAQGADKSCGTGKAGGCLHSAACFEWRPVRPSDGAVRTCGSSTRFRVGGWTGPRYANWPVTIDYRAGSFISFKQRLPK